VFGSRRTTQSRLGGETDGLADGLVVFDAWPETWEYGVTRTCGKIPNRVDRLKCIGNGQVPQTAAMAFIILSEGLND
jgi:hypothetical protein